MTDTPDPATQAAIDAVQRTFSSYGLDSLWTKALDLITSGYTDSNTILYSLKESPEYKARFSANDARVKAGLAELNPGTYVNLEQQYKDLMQSAGLPKGFYDQTDDFTGWIANDVSPAEAQSRVATARTAVFNTDPAYRQALSSMYGIDQDGLTAYFLDPEKATGMLEQQYNAATFKAAGTNSGVNVSNDTASAAGVQGISQQQAQQGFSQIGQELPTIARLGDIYNNKLSAEDLAKETFNLSGGTDVTAKKNKLASQERATFGSTSGTNQTSLSQKKYAL